MPIHSTARWSAPSSSRCATGTLDRGRSDDETTAAPVAKYPDKFVGFAYADPRRADRMELLRHAVEDLRLKGAKFGPIYNGVVRSDTRV